MKWAYNLIYMMRILGFPIAQGDTSEASFTKLTFQLLIVFEIQYVVGHGLLLLHSILLYVEVLACKY